MRSVVQRLTALTAHFSPGRATMGSTQGEDGLSQDIIIILYPGNPKLEVIGKLEAKFPGLKVHWQNVVPGSEPLPREIWDNVTILWTFDIPEVTSLPKLRFVQMLSAGADHWAETSAYKDPNVIFCTANGAHPPQIAEWVIGTWLSHQHQFPKYAAYQKEGYWEPVHKTPLFQDSWSLRMGILGYGAIGRQVANVAKALGMDVVVFTAREKSTPESRKDDSYCVPGTGDPDGLIPSRWFHGPTRENIDNFLNQDLDILVICLPLTASTKNIISRPQFEILAKKKTFLSNVGRGGHVETDDLIEALEKGMIRGAAMDVTNPEPLPKDHPLWKAPNLFITPHASWSSTNHFRRILDIFEHNLTALGKGNGDGFVNKLNKDQHY
ncbi:hypothetical protein PV11_00786 [Exophiala sideris]|uniref:D-isomer specific 2-hydroxyacid dehydrogenase NAD-binding domain-containing protein n=1 Tax=Exophiala sideris TaxID=1016849 RepID=A0A0D1W8K2_9EURO|nr:hypothetical protein PV11_00786 [Exophiala sideris]